MLQDDVREPGSGRGQGSKYLLYKHQAVQTARDEYAHIAGAILAKRSVLS